MRYVALLLILPLMGGCLLGSGSEEYTTLENEKAHLLGMEDGVNSLVDFSNGRVADGTIEQGVADSVSSEATAYKGGELDPAKEENQKALDDFDEENAVESTGNVIGQIGGLFGIPLLVALGGLTVAAGKRIRKKKK